MFYHDAFPPTIYFYEDPPSKFVKNLRGYKVDLAEVKILLAADKGSARDLVFGISCIFTVYEC